MGAFDKVKVLLGAFPGHCETLRRFLNISPEVVEEGGAATLSLVASIYPGPVAAEAVTWTISDPSGAASNLLVSPGQATEDGQYTASTVQVAET